MNNLDERVDYEACAARDALAPVVLASDELLRIAIEARKCLAAYDFETAAEVIRDLLQRWSSLQPHIFNALSHAGLAEQADARCRQTIS